MGVVYLAERADGDSGMRAAVKVVPLALASLGIEERSARERQFPGQPGTPENRAPDRPAASPKRVLPFIW